MAEIETFNKFMVAVSGRGIGMLNPPRGPMTADDALILAAYLVSIAEMDATHKFEEVLKAVQNA